MIRLKSLLTENESPGDYELGKHLIDCISDDTLEGFTEYDADVVTILKQIRSQWKDGFDDYAQLFNPSHKRHLNDSRAAALYIYNNTDKCK